MKKIFNFKENIVLSIIAVVFAHLLSDPIKTDLSSFIVNVILFTCSYVFMLVLDFMLWIFVYTKLIKSIWYFISTQVGYRFIILKVKIQKLFGKKLDESVIPKGLYCYAVDEEELTKFMSGESDGIINVKTCPYYGSMKGMNAACFYAGFIGWSPSLGDQCKICGKNYPNFGEQETEEADKE